MAAWSEALAALVAKLDEVEAQWLAQQAAAAAVATEATQRLHALGEAMVAETPEAPKASAAGPGEVVGSSQWRLDSPLTPAVPSLFAPEATREHVTSTGLLDRTEE